MAWHLKLGVEGPAVLKPQPAAATETGACSCCQATATLLRAPPQLYPPPSPSPSPSLSSCRIEVQRKPPKINRRPFRLPATPCKKASGKRVNFFARSLSLSLHLCLPLSLSCSLSLLVLPRKPVDGAKRISLLVSSLFVPAPFLLPLVTCHLPLLFVLLLLYVASL